MTSNIKDANFITCFIIYNCLQCVDISRFIEMIRIFRKYIKGALVLFGNGYFLNHLKVTYLRERERQKKYICVLDI